MSMITHSLPDREEKGRDQMSRIEVRYLNDSLKRRNGCRSSLSTVTSSPRDEFNVFRISDTLGISSMGAMDSATPDAYAIVPSLPGL